MQVKNKFTMTLPARSTNESFARACISAFASQLDPTIEEINDIKIKNDGNGYRVYFENEYGKFHDDIYVTKTFSSLNKIIEETYK